uniref:Uncharacterized protein n=1 Tax=Macrostomum lignano TaxID=282301 RepID=A0A1I8GRV4_9PLAT
MRSRCPAGQRVSNAAWSRKRWSAPQSWTANCTCWCAGATPTTASHPRQSWSRPPRRTFAALS